MYCTDVTFLVVARRARERKRNRRTIEQCDAMTPRGAFTRRISFVNRDVEFGEDGEFGELAQ
jgi:hypothetical protein